jgi:antitoxin (DNA-binding transcriptional repressor) of toxin-antitoxin stability system
MSLTLSVEEVQANFKELVTKLAPGQQILITQDRKAVARLVGECPARPPRPAPGLGKGSVLYMAPDFDEVPEEFREYVE